MIDVVTGAWERTSSSASLADRTTAVHHELHLWDRNTLKAPHHRLTELKEELEKLRLQPLTDESVDRQWHLQLLIEETLEKEGIYCVRRSRANWLKYGVLNTNFFNNFAKARKKRNYIRRLMGDNGVWVEDNEFMKNLISEFFFRICLLQKLMFLLWMS